MKRKDCIVQREPKKELDNRCIACNGSGKYDHNGSPKCDACNGTGRKMIMTLDEDTVADVAEFLETLRRSGETNMMGAGPYLKEEFGFDKYEARDYLLNWMTNYGK